MRKYFRATLLVTLFIGLVLVFDAHAGVREDFYAQWGGRINEARTPREKASLAVAMMNQADELMAGELMGENREWVLMLSDKAADLGKADPAGMPAASRALKYINQLDPTRSLECLKRLADLAGDYFNARPNQLGTGRQLVGVHMLIADQLETDLELALLDRDLAYRDQLKAYAEINKHYVLAKAALSRVAGKSQRILADVTGRGAPRIPEDRLQALKDFVAELGFIADELKRRELALQNKRNAARVIYVQEKKLKANPKDREAALTIVRVRALDLDQPEAAARHADVALGEGAGKLIERMYEAPSKISAKDHFELGRLCVTLGEDQLPPRQKEAYVHAYMHFDHYLTKAGEKADQSKQARESLAAIVKGLSRFEMDEAAIRADAVALAGELDLFGSGEQVAISHGSDTTSTDTSKGDTATTTDKQDNTSGSTTSKGDPDKGKTTDAQKGSDEKADEHDDAPPPRRRRRRPKSDKPLPWERKSIFDTWD